MSQPERDAAISTNERDLRWQVGSKLVDKIRIGRVSASNWQNNSEKGGLYSVTFERDYKK